MKQQRLFIWAMLTLVLAAALYRIVPNRPLGFAPQIAMALFAGAIIKDKKWAFVLPLISMLISDVLFQVLYNLSLTDIKGFYGTSQLVNYALFAGITILGFLIKKPSVANVFGFSLLAPTVYFIISNGLVWLNGGPYAINVVTGAPITKDISGLIQTYVQGLPFYRGSLIATFCFSIIFFGGYYILMRNKNRLSEA